MAVVLGSGLGGLASVGELVEEVPFAALPGVPTPAAAVVGHAGKLVIVRVAGVPVALFQGRFHTYQGLSALDAAYPARLAEAMGAETLVVTNAAGGLSADLDPGQLVLIADHINLLGDNPLVGWPGPEGGTPFVPMSDAYDVELRALVREVARLEGVDLVEGVYAAVKGPSYETGAETEYLRRIGADVVGMSTVPEVIVARALGLRVLGISLVTNVAGATGISHTEVLERSKQAEALLVTTLSGLIARL